MKIFIPLSVLLVTMLLSTVTEASDPIRKAQNYLDRALKAQQQTGEKLAELERTASETAHAKEVLDKEIENAEMDEEDALAIKQAEKAVAQALRDQEKLRQALHTSITDAKKAQSVVKKKPNAL